MIILHSIQRYYEQIKHRIVGHWVYPRHAAQEKEGSGTLVFTVTEDGALGDINVIQSTGTDILDRYMVNAVRLAAPFSRMPCRIPEGVIPLTMNFSYRLRP